MSEKQDAVAKQLTYFLRNNQVQRTVMVGHESGMTPQRVLEEASPNERWEMAFLLFSFQTVPKQTKPKMKKSWIPQQSEMSIGPKAKNLTYIYCDIYNTYILHNQSRPLVLKISYDQNHLC